MFILCCCVSDAGGKEFKIFISVNTLPGLDCWVPSSRDNLKINAALAAAREARKNKCLYDIFPSNADLDGFNDLSDIQVFAGTKLTSIPPPAVNLVGAALMTGMGYTQLKKAFQFCNVRVCAESTFYEKKIIPIVEAEVEKTVVAARELEKSYNLPHFFFVFFLLCLLFGAKKFTNRSLNKFFIFIYT